MSRRTHGSRFAGGYQFPRTDSVQLIRGTVIRRDTLHNGGTLTVTPLEGGRRKVFEVRAEWDERRPDGGIVTVCSAYHAYDEVEVRDCMRRLEAQARGA
jgi:hypothetical protein